MKIDIFKEPPGDIFRARSKYRLLTLISLGLGICGVLLAAYCILSETASGETLETIAFALFVVSAVMFGFFGEKLRGYSPLGPDEEKIFEEMALKHSEIRRYRDLVAKAGRKPITSEFGACKAWVDDLELKNPPQ